MGGTDTGRRARVCRSLVLLACSVAAGCGSDGDRTEQTTTRPATTSPATTSPATASTITGITALDPVRVLTPHDGFSTPTFLSIDDDAGLVYVVDADNGRIVAITLDGTTSAPLDNGGVPFDFDVHGPLGSVDVATDGSVYVAESAQRRMIHLAVDGTVLDTIRVPQELGRLLSASEDRTNNRTFAVDDNGATVFVFDNATGDLITTIGGKGSEPGQLYDTGSVEVLDDGTFWIADAGNRRAQHLTADGDVILAIGPFEKNEPGDATYPNDVAVDADGRIWLADFRGGGVLAYAPDGTPIGHFAIDELRRPSSLAFDADGLLYVTDWATAQVHVFRVS